MATQNQTIKKILIAPDKFKGSLTSTQAAEAIRRGLEEHFAGAGHDSGAGCAHSGAGGRISRGFCAREEDFCGAGHDSGAGCAQGGVDGHEMADICSPAEVCGGSGNVSEDICSPTAVCGGSGNVSAEICSPAAVCGGSGNVSGNVSGNGGVQFRIVEIADGGDGSLEVVEKRVANGRRVQCEAADPVGVRRPVEYLMYGQGGKESAFVEMAKVCGLAQLDAGLRNPLNTSTYGLGEVILDAVSRGAVSITLSIGGSATDDCGAGMLQALGYLFTDAAGNLLPVPVCGGDLEKIVGIKAPENKIWGNIEVICDVTNPLLGPEGATAVYAPQKGAGKGDLVRLEEGKRHFAGVAQRCLGIAPSLKDRAGAGAAGGVGYAGLAFLGAKLLPGWKFFAQITSLEESVRWADLVITGEGSLDSQSLRGKVVSGVLDLAAGYNKPVMIFCGVNRLSEEEKSSMLAEGISCHSLVSIEPDVQTCIAEAERLLVSLSKNAYLCRPINTY